MRMNVSVATFLKQQINQIKNKTEIWNASRPFLMLFLFGFIGTLVNKADKKTFWAFGLEEDEGWHMSRYTFQDSLRDDATLPLHFEPRLVNIHVDKETIDETFANFKDEVVLTGEEADKSNQRSIKMAAFLKSPEMDETSMTIFTQLIRTIRESICIKSIMPVTYDL